MKQNKTNNLVPVPELKTFNLKKKLKLNYLNYGTGTECRTAFTLVELIVVITILAILWTIAFISLQWYSKDTRNSVRLSDLSNINKMLWIKIVTAGKVPVPDNYVEITASWVTLNYQGEAGENVLPALWVSNGWKDPKDETYYTYSTNTNLTKYQLLWFMEGDAIASVLTETFAVSDLSERAVKVYWDDVWILLDSVTNIPVTTTVDVVNTTENYKLTFTNESLIEWTGSTMFLAFYSKHKELAEMDDSLVWYWDMETMSWSLIKDLSWNWNDGECYNSWTLVTCWSVDWPQFTSKWMNFDWIDDWMKVNDDDSLDFWSTTDFTFSVWINSKWSSDAQWILAKRTVGGFSQHFLVLPTHKQIGYYINDWVNIIYDNSNFINSLNTWYYVTVVIDRDWESWFYIDWNKINSFNISSIWNISNDSFLEIWCANIISYSSVIKKFNGQLDEIKIFNRALSENEISALYNSTK